MDESQLLSRSHDELLQAAAHLGIIGSSELRTEELVDAIALAQAAQERGVPWVQTPRVIFPPAEQMQTVLIRNPANRPVRLSLETIDPSGVFVIPPEFKDIELQGNDTLSVPVRLSPPKPPQGFLMTNAARYIGGIEVRDEAGQTVDLVRLSATGPGYQTAACMVVSSSLIPGLPWWLALEPRVRWHWQLKILPEVEAAWRNERCHVVWEVSAEPPVPFDLLHTLVYFSPDLFADGNDPTPTISSPPLTKVSASGFRTFPAPTTIRVDFRVDTGHGSGFAFNRWIRRRVGLGYGRASTAGPINENTMLALRKSLENIDVQLRHLHGISSNTALKRFRDPYLLDPGPEGLEQHILKKMQDVLIFTRRDYLPGDYREPPIEHTLCDDWIDAQGVHQVMYGMTPQDQSWVGICLEQGAADVGLLHELYHYAAAHDPHSECKAAAISIGCLAPEKLDLCWDMKVYGTQTRCGDLYPP